MDLSNVTSVFPMSYVHGAVTGGNMGRYAIPWKYGLFKEGAQKNSNQVFFHSVPLYFSHFPPPERSVLNHSSPRAGLGMVASRLCKSKLQLGIYTDARVPGLQLRERQGRHGWAERKHDPWWKLCISNAKFQITGPDTLRITL